MSSPLADTLFRATTSSPIAASAAPVRERGTRSRAGNAMNRTRAALMNGAARAVCTSGTKITMSSVATESGVAKATLYNHFRTREAVLAALVVHQVDEIIGAQADTSLAQALVDAATLISEHPVRAALARIEPGALAGMGRIDVSAEGWAHAQDAVSTALVAEGRGGVDIVLRWLSSFVLSPAEPAAVAADVAVLLTGLPLLEPSVETLVEPAGERLHP